MGGKGGWRGGGTAVFGLWSRNSKERPRFRHKPRKIANKKNAEKAEFALHPPVAPKIETHPISWLSDLLPLFLYPMMSMRGGPPLPSYPVQERLLQSAFALGLSFHHTFRALLKVGKTRSPVPAIFQHLHLLISAFINLLIRSFQPNRTRRAPRFSPLLLLMRRRGELSAWIAEWRRGFAPLRLPLPSTKPLLPPPPPSHRHQITISQMPRPCNKHRCRQGCRQLHAQELIRASEWQTKRRTQIKECALACVYLFNTTDIIIPSEDSWWQTSNSTHPHKF